MNRHDITEILLKVALNTITPNPFITMIFLSLISSFKKIWFLLYCWVPSFSLEASFKLCDSYFSRMSSSWYICG